MQSNQTPKETIETKALVETLPSVDTVLNGITDIVVIVDHSGVVTFMNDHALTFVGFTENQVTLRSNIFDHLPENWRALARNILYGLRNGQSSSTLDASCTLSDGRQMHFEIKCSAIMQNHCQVTHILIAAQDVTTQKIFEKKVTRFATEYHDLIENAHAAIIGTDTRGCITEWNRMASRTTGIPKEEAYTQKLADLILAPEDRREFTGVMDRIGRGQTVANHEVNIRASNGKSITFLINGTPKRNTVDEVIGMLLIGQDVTELASYRKSLEQRVQDRTEALKTALQKEKELVEIKNRFVSIASHEFRSPLSGIRSQVEQMKKALDHIAVSDALTRLDDIMSHVNHMTVLLEDVLTVGKSEADKIKVNAREVELNAFFKKIIEEVLAATNNSHTVCFSCAVPVLKIESDEKLLRNVFINLLSNAIKYSPGRNEVTLTIDTNAHTISVTVADYGIGIEPGEIERIFDPFNRGTNARHIKGTGLGLTIVKKAVETLNGKLFLESRVGEGTAFKVILNR